MKCEDRKKGSKAMTVPKWASEVADWARNHRAQAVGLGAAMMLTLVVSVSPRRQSLSPPELPVPEPAGGLLADIRGEDVLQRLRAGQAAIEREMEWVRNRLAAAEGVPSAGTDLVRSVAEVQAEYAEMEGFVGLLEAGQTWLRSRVIGCQIGLEELRERLEGLEQEDERN